MSYIDNVTKIQTLTIFFSKILSIPSLLLNLLNINSIFNTKIYFVFSGEFVGDIAIPFTEQFSKPKQKVSDLQEEIEKYKQEVLEGLQIEEEGLTDYFRKKTKQNPPVNNTQKYNDPTGDVYVNPKTHKNGQTLQSASSLKLNKAIEKMESIPTSSIGNIGRSTTISPGNRNQKVRTTRAPDNVVKSTAKRRKRHDSRRKHKTK